VTPQRQAAYLAAVKALRDIRQEFINCSCTDECCQKECCTSGCSFIQGARSMLDKALAEAAEKEKELG
jgi:hypothetical protein